MAFNRSLSGPLFLALIILLGTTVESLAASYGSLAIGAPYDSPDSAGGPFGSVYILHGSPEGLTSTGCQLINKDTLVPSIDRGDAFGWNIGYAGFFRNGSRYLAISSRLGDGPLQSNTGKINYFHILPDGTISSANMSASSNQEDSQFGYDFTFADFDGDGTLDLAAGAPFYDVSSKSNAGQIDVVYSNHEFGPLRAGTFFHQDNPVEIEGITDADDNFGKEVVAGDFNGDGYFDLAVGVPGEDILHQSTIRSNAGAVNIIYGSKDGLHALNNTILYQGLNGVVKGTPHDDEGFGSSLAKGDFNGDGIDDLAVGIPGDDVPTFIVPRDEAGSVQIFYGSSTGIYESNEIWNQETPYIIAETAQDTDSFGNDIAAGDFNGDGIDDLAVGVTGEKVGTGTYGRQGIVHIIYGTHDGLSADNNQIFHEDSEGIDEESPNPYDNFGATLAAGDLNGDTIADLAIYVVEQSRDSKGCVHVLYGTQTGLSTDNNQLWRAGGNGLPGSNSDDDHFGQALAIIPPPQSFPWTLIFPALFKKNQ